MKYKRKETSRHQGKVNDLFDLVRTLVKPNEDETSWLDEMKRLAEKQAAGWKPEFSAYLKGLSAGNRIAPEEANQIQSALSDCYGANPTALEITLPIAWLIVVALFVGVVQSISLPIYARVAIFSLAAVFGALWLHKSAWFSPKEVDISRPLRIFLLCITAALSVLFSYFVPAITNFGLQAVQMHRFQEDWRAFQTDPEGFPAIRKFASDFHHLTVVLESAANSWANTSLAIPGASPASMTVYSGFCSLNMNREALFSSFGSSSDVDHSLWVQGVMFHEFAHCLDVSRDMPSFRDGAVHTHSISPMDANKVKDLSTYIGAAEDHPTKLWREAIADIMAIGYWRLKVPGLAPALGAALRDKRLQASLKDRDHATMCWIDKALKASGPADYADLFSWAERLRLDAKCDRAAPQTVTRLDLMIDWFHHWYAKHKRP